MNILLSTTSSQIGWTLALASICVIALSAALIVISLWLPKLKWQKLVIVAFLAIYLVADAIWVFSIRADAGGPLFTYTHSFPNVYAVLALLTALISNMVRWSRR